MIKLLGLDQSQTATGWAVGTPDDTPPMSGVFRSAPWGNNEGKGILRFGQWLGSTILKYGVTDVCYEEPFIPQFRVVDIDAIKAMLFLESEINRVCADIGIGIRKVEIGVWRKRILGTTKAAPGLKGSDATRDLKDKAITACARQGWLIDDHNQAEALCVMQFGLSSLSKDYARKTGPMARRAELQQDIKAFRGE